MPEITSVEAIRSKLREFEERMDGAITAAKALARIKTDAEKLLAEIQGISTKSEQSLQKADTIRFKLQELQLEWHALRQKLERSENESKETRDLLLSELDSAIQSLGKKVSEAEERLRTTNKASLAEQADLLKRLDAATRGNADVAAKAQSTVTEAAERLELLVATLRNEIQSEVHDKLTKAEELLESEVQRIEKYLNQEQQTLSEKIESRATNHERFLREEMSAFKDEMRRNLVEHQHGIDRQLTDFLNKQNALVQNLSQQIDSFNRLSQAQSSDLAGTNTKLSSLSSAFRNQEAATANELAALTTRVTEQAALLAEVQRGMSAQSESIATVDSALQDTATQLSRTLEKLQHLPLVGGKFK